MKRVTCPGFDEPCGEILSPGETWTVYSTAQRDEWQGCEHCVMQALRYTHAEVADPDGVSVLEVAS